MENFEFKIFNSTLRFKGPMKYQVKINEKPTIFRTITMKASEFKELKCVDMEQSSICYVTFCF